MVRIKLKVKQLFVTRKLRKRLQNKNFTILSSNCLASDKWALSFLATTNSPEVFFSIL